MKILKEVTRANNLALCTTSLQLLVHIKKKKQYSNYALLFAANAFRSHSIKKIFFMILFILIPFKFILCEILENHLKIY